LDKKNLEVKYNKKWYKNEGLEALISLASSASVQQTLRRADFKERLDSDNDITLLEFLYPVLQGYDSVKVAADVEIGGADQKFNLLMGRRIQRSYNMKEQDIITVPLLEGTDGYRKMSKSFGNYIGLTEKPFSMFEKIMTIPDSLIEKYFLLCTDIEFQEIEKIKENLSSRTENPRNIKLWLAKEIVSIYYGEEQAKIADTEFTRVFTEKELPSEIDKVSLSLPKDIVYVLVHTKATSSKAQAWRLIDQGGVRFNNQLVNTPQQQITDGGILQVGKKKFVKVIPK